MSEQTRIPLIIVHGPTCSGKTTFAGFITKYIGNSKKIVIISTDNYFNDIEEIIDSKGRHYDFDSPAHIDWDGLKRTLLGYGNRDKLIHNQAYSFSTQTSTSEVIQNEFPDLIVLEGIYAFNLFNEEKFDISKLDPYITADLHDSDVLMPNEDLYTLKSLFDYKKILFDINYDMLFSFRCKRDFSTRVIHQDERAFIQKRIAKYMWPAVKHWVLSSQNTYDCKVRGGTHNIEGCMGIMSFLLGALDIVDEGENTCTMKSYISPDKY